MLTPDQREFYATNGYLHLPSFFETKDVDSINAYHEDAWRQKPNDVSVDHLDTGKRSRMSQLSEEDSHGRFKINDLYMKDEGFRDALVSYRLSMVLEHLMVDRPVLINTLSIEFGTQQGMHLDSLYMTPHSPFNLVGVWVALEDGAEDTGPLFYYPKSHLIKPYKFSNGRFGAVSDEMKHWESYMKEEIRRYDLKREVFIPKKGDVLIWSAYLLHGGSPVKDHGKTRKSIVSHYFAESDARRAYPGKVVESEGGLWLKKKPVFHNELSSSSLKNPLVSFIKSSKLEKPARKILNLSRKIQGVVGP